MTYPGLDCRQGAARNSPGVSASGTITMATLGKSKPLRARTWIVGFSLSQPTTPLIAFALVGLLAMR